MKVLAFDFGASSGRAILGEYNDKNFNLTEVHRYVNSPINQNGHMYWDYETLSKEVINGVKKCVSQGHSDIASIGIDTWGVDFGLIGEDGELLSPPFHYRDCLTDDIMDEFFKVMPKDILYEKTGTQIMQFNTVFQLFAINRKMPELLAKTKKILFMPNLFAYMLTGVPSCEFTVASTSGMLNVHTGDFDEDILKAIGISRDLFPDVLQAGSKIGILKKEIAIETGMPQVDIVLVAGHDTASAIAATPLQNEKCCYLSCGTWSLLGTEIKAPNSSKSSYEYNFTNEGGVENTTRFLKNITGLWILQESRREWGRQDGTLMNFGYIAEQIAKTTSRNVFISPDYEPLGKAGDVPSRINDFLKLTNQATLNDRIEIANCILESLALTYDRVIIKLEEILNKKFDTLCIIGGGVQDKNLMQYAANATGRRVLAGPVEATGLGNIIVQLIANGKIADIASARKLITEFTEYLPKDAKEWEKKKKLCNKALKNFNN